MLSEDFLTSYRSPIVEYDREVYTMMTNKGRIHRKVDIFFGCIFIFAGLLYALIVQGHSAGIFIAAGFGIYGLIIISIRTSSFWRMQSIEDPNAAEKRAALKERITYDYFARRCPKKGGAAKRSGAEEWVDPTTQPISS